MHNKIHKGKTTYVYADWHDTEPQLIGNLYSEVKIRYQHGTQ